MLYLIDLLTDNLDELNFATGEDADQFAYGEKTAYAECLEVIQLWSESEKNGLDYSIEKKYPIINILRKMTEQACHEQACPLSKKEPAGNADGLGG